MQTNNIVLAVGLVTMANPAQANLGQAGNVIFKFFTDVAGQLVDLIINSSSASIAYDHSGNVRKDEAPPGVPQHEYDRCYADITGVTVTASSPEPGSKYLHLPQRLSKTFSNKIQQRSSLTTFHPLA